ncbi:acetylglutamate kinase [Vulgatibacter sp.]|uniref:acetylglutamate kinase n=1 Tax=Vulgatibacter sp. TaxID=1971226 RepID=UPI0035669DDA
MSFAAEKGRWYVVKIGGELIAPGKLAGLAEAIRAFHDAGVKVAIVHGGGPQATELTRRIGLEPRQIAGRRVTDEQVLRVMKQALAGEVNVDLAALLRAEGVRVLGLHGVSGGLVDGVKRPPRVIAGGPSEPVDLGYVGDVTGVNVELLEHLAAGGWVPAIASIAGDAQGGVWNINADTVATRIAAELGAARLLLVSGVPGVLRDPKDPSTRIGRLTPAETEGLIDQGVISGGMIPKVLEAIRGLDAGIEAVHVCGAAPGQVLAEVRAPGSAGTVFLQG